MARCATERLANSYQSLTAHVYAVSAPVSLTFASTVAFIYAAVLSIAIYIVTPASVFSAICRRRFRKSNSHLGDDYGKVRLKLQKRKHFLATIVTKLDDATKGFIEGERIAKLSTFTLLGIGLVEVLVGQLSDSVGLTADGVDSLADASISLVVWLGLRFSRKAPDERFHFGYLKMESLAALVASLGMIAVASTLLYYSYLRLLNPKSLSYPAITLVTLLGAGSISLYRALQMRKIAKKYNLLSLKTDAHNSIKDASASFVVFAAVLTSTLGFIQMDAVGGIIIAGYIYSIAYVSIREASLVLIDACHRPELVEDVKKIVEGKYAVEVEEVRLRRAGPYIIGIVSVAADGTLTLNQVGEMKRKIKHDLRDQIRGLGGLSVVVHPQRRSNDTKQRL